jgi:succinyl-diaminopimelate desuccinylase
VVDYVSSILNDLGVNTKVLESSNYKNAIGILGSFSPLGIEAIDFGPIGENAHGPNENVNIKSLEQTSKFYEDLTKEHSLDNYRLSNAAGLCP